ncbi:MAG: hypothetical protein C0602_08525 [Denitrovibrio sp.]|nr:MAG: hypothetical protein C0602_08525 [Denitrovibrio sp.]
MRNITGVKTITVNKKIALILRDWLADKRTHSTVNIKAHDGAEAIKEILSTKNVNQIALNIINDNLESLNEKTRNDAESVTKAINCQEKLYALRCPSQKLYGVQRKNVIVVIG